MNAATIIAVLVIALLLYAAIRYIYKEKKKGSACIGCPYASSCQKHRSGASCSIPQEAKDKADLTARNTEKTERKA